MKVMVEPKKNGKLGIFLIGQKVRLAISLVLMATPFALYYLAGGISVLLGVGLIVVAIMTLCLLAMEHVSVLIIYPKVSRDGYDFDKISELLNKMNRAGRSVYLALPNVEKSVFCDDRIAQALRVATERGLEVVLLVGKNFELSDYPYLAKQYKDKRLDIGVVDMDYEKVGYGFMVIDRHVILPTISPKFNQPIWWCRDDWFSASGYLINLFQEIRKRSRTIELFPS